MLTPKGIFLQVAFIYIMAICASGRQLLVSGGIGRLQRAAFSSLSPSHFSFGFGFGFHEPHATFEPRQRQAGFERRCKVWPQNPRVVRLFTSAVTNSDINSSEDEEYDWDTVLPFEKHSHNSVKITVTANKEAEENKSDTYDYATFYSKLEATVATAQQLHKTAVWLTIPISRARLMEEADKAGFEFHHAEGNAATLSKWLLEEEESRIPTYATHQVGVGAVVINSATEEILCVREKRNNYRPWKIPGGLAELGEDLDEAVIREVL